MGPKHRTTSARANTRVRAGAPIAWCCAALWLAACGGAKAPPVRDLAGGEDLSRFALVSLGGTRDGDRLAVDAAFSDGASSLHVEMHFAVGVPTSLSSGAWRWERNGAVSSGAVTARSVTFLGGQSGRPSIGGSFDLAGPDGTARYRINIPVQELKSPFRGLLRLHPDSLPVAFNHFF